jgi:hypothetical protein
VIQVLVLVPPIIILYHVILMSALLALFVVAPYFSFDAKRTLRVLLLRAILINKRCIFGVLLDAGILSVLVRFLSVPRPFPKKLQDDFDNYSPKPDFIKDVVYFVFGSLGDAGN